MSDFEDKTITCIDCGDDFEFTAGEQKFYQSKAYVEPKRCALCRRKKKDERGDR